MAKSNGLRARRGSGPPLVTRAKGEVSADPMTPARCGMGTGRTTAGEGSGAAWPYRNP